jgi:phage tail sheath protein FI
MSKVLATPGVYIEEKSAFSSSVSAVATAVPAFVGYTESAKRGKKSLINQPTRISSLADYIRFFGKGPKTTFTIEPDAELGYTLNADAGTEYYMYNSVRLFFANGGGNCYIVSVGDYSNGVSASQLNDGENGGGIHTLLKEQEPTMVVIPDAMLLEAAECYSVQQAMLMHCGKMQSRVAVLDVHNGYQERTLADDDVINAFRGGIGSGSLHFGAVYYPWVNTSIIQANELDFSNISNIDTLQELLTAEAQANLDSGAIKEKRFNQIVEVIAQLSGEEVDDSVSKTLLAVSPLFKEVLASLKTELNVLPPSGAIAGAYALVDNTAGVHQAPANINLNGVISPTVNITSENQEDLNLPLNGKAVNAIRGFVGRGTLVWGARTLDGNSQDWRYISVRRTIIMVEQSIKNAVEAFVFQPNTANTWVSLRGTISNFLSNLWKQGSLVGASPAEAFSVEVGLGSTMTPTDILDGIMRITVKVAVSRPAEFIVITFQQEMQKS